MLTIFSIPKAFRGHIDVIQRNAITSWTLLHPRPEIILLGDDEGTAAVAKELGVHHCPVVCRNEYGTPLVDDLFEKAHSLARNDVLCYANADIILMSDFMDAVRRVAKWRRRFLMIGRRWDVDVDKRLDFGQQWDGTLRSDTAKRGRLHDEAGIDYMVFRRGVWQQIPPFAIGRPAWDNWMVYAAHSRGVAVVDATPVVTAIHQNHDYSHVRDGEGGSWKGPEERRNKALAKGGRHDIDDATWLLGRRSAVPAVYPRHLRRRLAVWLARHPHLHAGLRAPRRLLSLLRKISRAIVGAIARGRRKDQKA